MNDFGKILYDGVKKIVPEMIQRISDVLDRMRDEGLIRLVGSGRSSKYILVN